jgi:hypothetical protein
MSLTLDLLWVGLAAYFGIAIATVIVHHGSVAPFLTQHGEKPSEFAACCMLGIGLVRDYLVARRLCTQRGMQPRWMKRYISLLAALAMFGAVLIIFVLFSKF